MVNIRIQDGLGPGDGVPLRLKLTSWLLPVLLLLLVALAVGEPRFLSPLNLSRNISYLAIVSLGQMFVMILGGMDLSVGVVVALSSVTTALVMARASVWYPDHELLALIVASCSALAVSALVGLVNGLCVAKGNASAFIVTLGAFSVVGGVSYYITAGIPIYGLPTSFTNEFGRRTMAGVPFSVYVALGLGFIVLIIQQWTRFGRHLYAIGGNPHAARLSGIAVDRSVILAYFACSLLAGVAGVLITARIGAGQANLGSEYMLQSIAVGVVAGISLRGGVGRVEMLLLSSILVTVLANAMNLIRIDSKLQPIVFGIILLAAMLMDRRKRVEGDDA